jgi:hypothetical protein
LIERGKSLFRFDDGTFDRPVPVESSNVKAIGYKPSKARLRVQFLNGGDYEYAGVSPETYENLLDADSKGSAFWDLVRENNSYRRIDGGAKKEGSLSRGSLNEKTSHRGFLNVGFLTKTGEDDLYAHRTSREGLQRILGDGEIKTVRALRDDDPDRLINVEPYPTSLIRREMTARKAYDQLRRWKKDPDHVFVTKGGYIDNDQYGDYIISQKTDRAKPSTHINPLTEEHLVPERLPVDGARIYVPDEEVDELAGEFSGYEIRPRSEAEKDGLKPLPSVSLTELARRFQRRLGGAEEPLEEGAEGNEESKEASAGEASFSPSEPSLLGAMRKIFGDEPSDEELKDLVRQAREEAPDEKEIQRLIDPKAQIQGSTGLGINIPGKSDIDVMIPAESKDEMQAKIDNLRSRFDDLTPSPYNRDREQTYVMSGTIDGTDMDVVVGHGPDVKRRIESFNQAREKLTDEDRGRIIKTKKDLKDAWVLSKPRYKRYKRGLDNDLDIIRL